MLIRRKVKLNITQGLHIRACSKVVALVGDFDGQIRIHSGERVADAHSMFDLVQLAALPGSEIILEGNGEGIETLFDSLEQMFSKKSEAETPDPS